MAAAQTSKGPLLSDRSKSLAEVVVGALLILLGLGTLLRGGSTPRKPPRLRTLDRVRPAQAFGLGLVLAALNPNVPILLAGLGAIAAADVSGGTRVVGAVVLIVASQLGLAGPILWFATRRDAAGKGLARIRSWIGRHQRALEASFLLVFGAAFLAKGVAGL